MRTDLTQLQSAIRDIIKNMGSPILQDVHAGIQAELKQLCNDRHISFGPDHNVGEFGLECRVKDLFLRMGLLVRDGRKGLEDLIVTPVTPPEGNSPTIPLPAIPLVVEVKSSRKAFISRDDLRQLDDWVFELSGEEQARKHGITLPGNPILQGYGGVTGRHGTPHKGVMVFNGPVGMPFNSRTVCLGPNEEEFAKKRNFAIIPLATLIDCEKEITSRSELLSQIWASIHKCEGRFTMPSFT